jgi:hypothetical protein
MVLPLSKDYDVARVPASGDGGTIKENGEREAGTPRRSGGLLPFGI